MRLFAIYGNPVAHSKSPRLHNATFSTLGMTDCAYTRFLLAEGSGLVAHFRQMELSGANVTVPFKEEAFMQCDEVRGLAKEIGAVNTLVKEGNKVIGYNTDCSGFMESIREFEGVESILILGAGGTARAVALALKEAGKSVCLINRSDKRLEFFKAQGFETATWDHFTPRAFDLVVNTTSAGLSDNSLPAPVDLLNQLLPQAKYAYDVIYGKEPPFLEMAMRYGLIMKDGKDMLVAQAVHAFMHFTGLENHDRILKIMEKTIEL